MYSLFLFPLIGFVTLIFKQETVVSPALLFISDVSAEDAVVNFDPLLPLCGLPGRPFLHDGKQGLEPGTV